MEAAPPSLAASKFVARIDKTLIESLDFSVNTALPRKKSY